MPYTENTEWHIHIKKQVEKEMKRFL
jgi:hypothetical protein